MDQIYVIQADHRLVSSHLLCGFHANTRPLGRVQCVDVYMSMTLCKWKCGEQKRITTCLKMDKGTLGYPIQVKLKRCDW